MNDGKSPDETQGFSALFARYRFIYVFCGVALAYVFLYPVLIAVLGLQETVFADPYLRYSTLFVLLISLGIFEYRARRKEGNLTSGNAFVRAKLVDILLLFLLGLSASLLLTSGYDFLVEQTEGEGLAMLLTLFLLAILIILFRRVMKRAGERNVAAEDVPPDNGPSGC